MGKNILLSAVSGALWGWIAIAVNAASGAFEFESGLLHNLFTFTASGAVMGIIVGVFLILAGPSLPFKGFLPKAVLVSTLLWLVLRVAGAALSHMDSERYHVVTWQTFQGLSLAVILGGILGILWDKRPRLIAGQ